MTVVLTQFTVLAFLKGKTFSLAMIVIGSTFDSLRDEFCYEIISGTDRTSMKSCEKLECPEFFEKTQIRIADLFATPDLRARANHVSDWL
jgi:hypothetical protein